MTDTTQLQERLRNCLQTILELEPNLEKLEDGHLMRKEFFELKQFITRVDEVALDEAAVIRIESATADFLREVQVPLAALEESDAGGRVVQ